MTELKWPSLRRYLDIMFLLGCLVLVADVLGPELFGNGKTKDYRLWYNVGQLVLQGKALYVTDGNGIFEYLYPPFPAVLLALPSYFGKLFLYSLLTLIGIICWWVSIQFSNAMGGSEDVPDRWVASLPAALTAVFVFDNFDLGQPTVILLALMLYGFWLMRRNANWAAGAMFALATAIKVYPVAVLPYLLWRKQWVTAASMAAFLGIFLVLVPAPVRGFERNIAELKIWYNGMVGSSSADGYGQRSEQNWSLVNQSLIAMTHRFVRPVNYNQNDPAQPPRYVNFLNLDYKQANGVLLALSALIGLAFIWVMPKDSKRTRLSNAAELGILFCLMTVASPLAREYYFMWLMFPLTVLVQRAAYDPRRNARIGTWAVIAVTMTLLALSFPIFSTWFQAAGNNFFATALLAVALGWHIVHEPRAA